MLKLRLIFGSALAVLALAVLGLDAYLSESQSPPPLRLPGTDVDLAPWIRNGALTTLLTLLFALAAVQELLHMARRQGYRPVGALAHSFSAALITAPYVEYQMRARGAPPQTHSTLALLVAALMLAFLAQALRRKSRNAAVNIGSTLFIILYVGAMLGFVTRLRMSVGGAAGVAALLFSIAVLKMNDTGAFFVGRSYGKHKLIAWLSPGKTWQGFAGGLATALATSLAVGSVLHFTALLPMPATGTLRYPWGLILFGVVMGLISVAGDLCASLLKRDAEVKDSGNIIPGLGGALDVLDSLILGAPVAWFFWTVLLPM